MAGRTYPFKYTLAPSVSAVLNDLRAFKGPVEFEDDATLVVVKWVPTGQVTE